MSITNYFLLIVAISGWHVLLAVLRGCIFRKTYSKPTLEGLIPGLNQDQTLLVLLVMPFIEEAVMCWLGRPYMGISAAAVLFGVIHGFNATKIAAFKTIMTTVMALIIGNAWEQVGRGWSGYTLAVALHFTWNGVAISMPYLEAAFCKLRGLPDTTPDLLAATPKPPTSVQMELQFSRQRD